MSRLFYPFFVLTRDATTCLRRPVSYRNYSLHVYVVWQPFSHSSMLFFYVWGVAVFELVSHSDYNKGPDLRTLRKTHPHYVTDNQHFDYKTFVWKSLLCMVMSCSSLRPGHFPYSYSWRAFVIAAVGTTFNVFIYDIACSERRSATCYQLTIIGSVDKCFKIFTLLFWKPKAVSEILDFLTLISIL